MAVATQRLTIGQVVEIDGRLYDVIPDKEGGAALESAITFSVDDIHRLTGGRPATPEQLAAFRRRIQPPDGEG